MVIHSATKYLGGHSDVVGGVALTSDERLAEHLAFFQNGVGAVPSPFDAYLVLRGLKTLAVRMDRHCHNARADRRAPGRSRRASSRCSTRGWPIIPAMTSRLVRCPTSAGWCRFVVADVDAAPAA